MRLRKAAVRKATAREAAAASVPSAPPSSVVRVGSLLDRGQSEDDSHSELLIAAGILLALVMAAGSLVSLATRTTRGRLR